LTWAVNPNDGPGIDILAVACASDPDSLRGLGMLNTDNFESTHNLTSVDHEKKLTRLYIRDSLRKGPIILPVPCSGKEFVNPIWVFVEPYRAGNVHVDSPSLVDFYPFL